LLQALQAQVLPWATGTELALLEDRWLCRLEGEGVPPAHVEGGGLLFALAARMLDGDGEEAYALGRAWAQGLPVTGKTSTPLRPLRALTDLAARDADRRTAGHPPEARGSLVRQWLMLKVVALGR
jgi:15-cis-phytoene synthase